MYKAEIDCSEIHSKLDFMQAMDKAFGFPTYFGENWDALWDCMRDMYWINDSEIVLEFRNRNALIGKLKSELISFFENLKTHLEQSTKNLEQKVHFDVKFLD